MFFQTVDCVVQYQVEKTGINVVRLSKAIPVLSPRTELYQLNGLMSGTVHL